LVYIKRIDIRGFKTFNKKVSIPLDPGFTVITGPNGSGKSNILDSLKFALGELSARELRGGSLSALIHKSGTETARSAHVAVQFDNTDRKIPVDSDLVTVSREFSTGGEGIYRMNGRRLSRKQAQDILSSADIQVTGWNLIAQHSITRLAEISTEERRRILEDLIGLGVFETKKAEAKSQLQEADVNLKVAASKVEDVRSNIERLERERNDLLRSKMIQKEIANQQALILSSQILSFQTKRETTLRDLENEQKNLEDLRRRRDELTYQRTKVDAERRNYEENTVTQGNQALFDVERKIADASNGVVKAKAEAETARNILNTRIRQLLSLQKQGEDIQNNTKELMATIKTLSSRKGDLEERFQEANARAEKLNNTLSTTRDSLSKDSEVQEALDAEIRALESELSTLIASSKGSSAKLDLTANHLQTLEARHKEFANLAEELKRRIREMEKLGKEEEKRLEDIEAKTKEYTALKDQRHKEIDEALDVAKRARVTVTEFNTQKNLADTLQAEEKALRKIEEMADEGALNGIMGRLQDLVKFNDEYSKAIEAASAGWMRALVVKDLTVAIKCVESLKRTKLGRAKIIPLDDLELPPEGEESPETPGIVGPLSRVIKADKGFSRAVEFVFGDTMLATNQRAAFLTAAKGQRCVVTSGDLYEPGGGLESGYYRAPFDASTLIPRSNVLEGLERTVKSLESIVQRSRSELDRLEGEIGKLREDRVSATKTREAFTRDVVMAQRSLEHARLSLQQTKRRIESLENSMQRERELLEEMAAKQGEMKRRLEVRKEELAKLKVVQRRGAILQAERERDEAVGQAESLLREKLELDNRLASSQSTLDTLKPAYDQLRIQFRSLESEIRREEARVEESGKKSEELQVEMKKLNEEKTRLVESLKSVGEERRKYEDQFSEIEKSLNNLIKQMDPINSNVSELKATLRELDTQVAMVSSQLRTLGFEKTLETTVERIEDASRMKLGLEKELEDIGAVNQLAVEQYEGLKDGYKHLSERIGELERDKLGVLNFMGELEKKKLDTFMTAFTKVNETFQQIFHEITEGGNGRMALVNPDNPFEGGLDVFLQFPGKTELTMAAASGGEKSVSTVCYLLALQQIHPMPFYIMDEIDAHLDVLNTKRLATLVRSKSGESQFIVISLKDTTISRADRVFGVFVEGGQSKVISLPNKGGVNN
jgi:chromosome segregation protein